MKKELIDVLEKLMNNKRGLDLVLKEPSLVQNLLLVWNDKECDSPFPAAECMN